MQVKITRLITNQIIIGKTSNDTDLFIEDPYEIIPTPEGVQMIPLDKHILGKEISSINIHMNNVMYSEEPSELLRNKYLETLSGIEIPENKLII